MTVKSKMAELQQLYFDIEDVTCCTSENLNKIGNILIKYNNILNLFYKKNPDIFANLFQIGIGEILDHARMVHTSSSQDARNIFFIDLKIYLQQAILDCRRNLQMLRRK
ncbi:hypothetical protein SAMN06265348_1244 [Pedobacter westerhofensis]|uniref:Uncharacterized protein n=1 Tax=Pedobacter westerhofensis TaxID=425512 RepID=A0A521FTP8_9SPHI|nr:hypothetical protein SAMN06265348_1244 [Pedobacter westerhofensis]